MSSDRYNPLGLIGKYLSHFKITARLGQGGMGEVYRAEDTKLKRDVALKILPPEVSSSTNRLERFQRQAETLAALDSLRDETRFRSSCPAHGFSLKT